MIRVYKSPNAPSSLTTTKRYDGEDVKKQLLADQHDKCYLCERNRDTDFEIEHHKSENHYHDLVQDWNNLYMGCGYCNKQKSDSFDNTLAPKDFNIEDEIEQSIDFANKNLFLPLGIPKHTIHGDSSKEDQFDFFMNKGPRKNEWYSAPQDTVTAGWGLCTSGRDLARIGSMVLNEGKYARKRIVSSEWIERMTTPCLKLGERFGFMEYGFLWYKPYGNREIYAAIGDCGNIIYVNKEVNLSVGITGTFKPRVFDRVDFIEEKVIPLVTLC